MSLRSSASTTVTLTGMTWISPSRHGSTLSWATGLEKTVYWTTDRSAGSPMDYKLRTRSPSTKTRRSFRQQRWSFRPTGTVLRGKRTPRRVSAKATTICCFTCKWLTIKSCPRKQAWIILEILYRVAWTVLHALHGRFSGTAIFYGPPLRCFCTYSIPVLMHGSKRTFRVDLCGKLGLENRTIWKIRANTAGSRNRITFLNGCGLLTLQSSSILIKTLRTSVR